MQKQQIKIVKLINGDDIVTDMPVGDKQLPDKSILIRLNKPLQIKYVPQITPTGFRDYIALIRWTNYTNDNVVTIPKDKILTIANATLPFTKRYHKLLGTLKANPQKLPSFVERDLTNEEYNDIDKEEAKDTLKSLKSLFDMPSKKIH